MLESVAPSDLRGNQRPGLLHLPPDGTDAYVDDALYLLGEWGFGYDDAQNFTMACALREQPDGRWAAKEFGLEEPRQNGKGEVIEGRETLGLFFLDERLLIHSAHEFATASEALDRMEARILSNPNLKQRVKSIKRSHGEEGVYLKDGRKLLYKTRTKGGGRGFSADLLILDEAMYIADAFLGALMPVISARPNPQMWYTGSAVDQMTMTNGIVFARLRDRALRGDGGRMAYLGWSPAYERQPDGKLRWETPTDVPRDEMVNPAVIAQANPALGIRIELDHIIETEFGAMDHRTFAVERLGVGDWPSIDGSGDGIEIAAWTQRLDPDSELAGAVCFAADVNPERTAAAIGAAGWRPDGEPHIEPIEHRAGTDWVIPRLVELVTAHGGIVRIDDRGPAGSLVEAARQAMLPVETVSIAQHARACGQLHDAIHGTLHYTGDPEQLAALNAAVKGAKKRPLGDAWAWSRKNSGVDISPLVACTLALGGIVEAGQVGGGFSW